MMDVSIERSLHFWKNQLSWRLSEMSIGEESSRLLKDMASAISSSLQPTCLVLFCDINHHHLFTHPFFFNLAVRSLFVVVVNDREDLLSPNYPTLSALRRARTEGCNAYFILLSNGDQAGRLLTFGDRHRLISTGSNLLMVYDKRLFRRELHYLWQKMVNVVFFRRFRQTSRFELSTVPFPVPVRNILVPRRIDTWRDGRFQTGATMYRDKTGDLEGQAMRVAVVQHVPSVLPLARKRTTDQDDNRSSRPTAAEEDEKKMVHKDGRLQFTGLEIEMVIGLSKALNFRWEVFDVGYEAWGHKQLNGSYSGLVGEVTSARADLALGNLYHSQHHLALMDLSVPYATQCLTFLTPESLTDNSWQTLLLPFTLNMWIGIIVALAVGAGFFLTLAHAYHTLERRQQQELMKMGSISVSVGEYSKKRKLLSDRFDSLADSLLYSWGMLAQVSLPALPVGWGLRLMTGCWWIYSILIAVAYRASLTAILANPMPRVTIDTVDQLASSRVRCGGWGQENREFFTTSQDLATRAIGEKFEVVDDPEAMEAVARVAAGTFAYYSNIYFLRSARVKHNHNITRQQASSKPNINITTSSSTLPTLTGEDEVGNEEEKKFDEFDTDEDGGLILNSGGHNLHVMRDCVIRMPVSLGLQKNSPLKSSVDKYVRRFVEAGLVNKWLADSMLDTSIAEAPLSRDEVKAIVDLSKLYAAFIALAVGHSIGLLALLIENLHWLFIVQRDPGFDKYRLAHFYHSQHKQHSTLKTNHLII